MAQVCWGIAHPMRLMGLMRWPEDLIVNHVLARKPGENYHLSLLLYIDDPRSQGGSLSSLMSIFTL